MAVREGTKLGPYEIVSLLGAGGMGEVYRARDPRLNREVAIKVLPADRVSDEDRRRRFVQEAHAASALNHPHIITIHEIESANGIDFIAMEYVRVKSLDALIPRHGMRLGGLWRLAAGRRAWATLRLESLAGTRRLSRTIRTRPLYRRRRRPRH